MTEQQKQEKQEEIIKCLPRSRSFQTLRWLVGETPDAPVDEDDLGIVGETPDAPVDEDDLGIAKELS